MTYSTALLLEDSPALIARVNEDLLCCELSRGWQSHLQQLKSFSPRPFTKLFSRKGAKALGKQLNNVLKNDLSMDNVPVEIRTGKISTPARLSAWRVLHASDAPFLILLATCNTTPESSPEVSEDLVKLQALNKLILHSAGEGIYGLDSEGRLTFGNPAAESIVGWNTMELLGQKSHDVHHHSHPDGSHYPRDDCPIYAALKDGKVHTADHEVFWHADGSAVPVEYTSTPMLVNGKPEGAVVVFRDISERKLQERQKQSAFEEIQTLKEQLEQERDYLRDEINVISHFGEIIGNSTALKSTLAQIESVASTPVNVLVSGEPGVGKELIARAIHSQSDRAEKPLVKVTRTGKNECDDSIAPREMACMGRERRCRLNRTAIRSQ